MDLLCTETVNINDCENLYPMEKRVNKAVQDPTYLEDRCLENLLKAEENHATVCTYFGKIQKDITPSMRKLVAEWIIEVCEEERCQEEVSILTLNYMDRFLSSMPINKTHLQILAAACLLLASKLREPSCRALPVELLVFYTDHSITKNDLIRWELIVLSRLKWDVSSVTPLDFLELLLSRLPIENKKCHDINKDTVRRHAQAFISLAAREHYFSNYTASTIAASSIAAALSGLKWHLRSGITINHLLNRFTDLTGVEQEYICECMTKMEELFQQQRTHLPSIYITATATTTLVQPQQQHMQQQNQTINIKSKSTTPTDVQDIDF